LIMPGRKAIRKFLTPSRFSALWLQNRGSRN